MRDEGTNRTKLSAIFCDDDRKSHHHLFKQESAYPTMPLWMVIIRAIHAPYQKRLPIRVTFLVWCMDHSNNLRLHFIFLLLCSIQSFWEQDVVPSLWSSEKKLSPLIERDFESDVYQEICATFSVRYHFFC